MYNNIHTEMQRELEILKQQSRFRQLHETSPLDGLWIERGGKHLLSFASNDYFGLSQHPQVIAAMGQASRSGAGASPLVSGAHPAMMALQDALAAYKNYEAALLFGSGYLANIGVISALATNKDIIFADKLAHACMLDGAHLSGAKLIRFAHNDTAHLQTLMTKHRAHYRHAFILTETIFSMDGDASPMGELRNLSDSYQALLIADDAHGLALYQPSAKADILIGTLSKGLGAYGGFVCADRIIIDYLINHARSLIFSTALPPSICVAAQAALSILQADTSLAAIPLQNAAFFCQKMGLPAPQSAIVPWIVGEDAAALALSAHLQESGFLVPAIRPPTVPPGTARLRFAFTALHSLEQIDSLVKAFSDATA